MLQIEIMLEDSRLDETGPESAHIRAIVQEVSYIRASANVECFIGQAVHSYIYPVFHNIFTCRGEYRRGSELDDWIYCTL
jgi:hypothetical protein